MLDDLVIPLEQLPFIRDQYKAAGKIVVATSGCFDLMHSGHAEFLKEARSLGDVLIVGLNSDASTRRIKGPGRPILPQTERARMLGALRSVDYVSIFDELTPHRFLGLLKPDFFCKGSEYSLETLPEKDVVVSNGGQVRLLSYKPGISSSFLMNRIRLSSQGDIYQSSNNDLQIEGWQLALEQMLTSANVIRQSAYLFAKAVEQTAQQITQMVPGSIITLHGNKHYDALIQDIAHVLAHAIHHQNISVNILISKINHPTLSQTRIPNTDLESPIAVQRLSEWKARPDDMLIALTLGTETGEMTDICKSALQNRMNVVAFTSGGNEKLAALAHPCFCVPSHDILEALQIQISLLQTISRRLEKIAHEN